MKPFAETNDFLRVLKSRISPANFQLIAAINHVVSVYIKNRTVQLGIEEQIYYEYINNQIEYVEAEAKKMLDEEFQVELLHQTTRSPKTKLISEINEELIKKIFGGHRII